MTKRLQNQKHQDISGGKFTYKWLGPYNVANITKTGLCTLMKQKRKARCKKFNFSLLKQYFSDEISKEVADKNSIINPIQPDKLDCTAKAEE